MSDEDAGETPADSDQDLEVSPAGDEAYPALELTQLTESDCGEHDDGFPDDE
jgi:hypothetical protein